ncbi:MAG: hypothetical protein JSW50_00015 [Candidatus Latescibacterota bacterium]|nr:MAG: hypothetical protein JSW50_00015 [Candidatus Latescibacterota bacterium]
MSSFKYWIILFLVVVLVGCQSGGEPVGDTTALSENDQKNLELVAQDNVAYFGAPPLIPAEHSYVIGEDVMHHENGGPVCLDCHGSGDEEDAPQTRHPERHNCLQCHVPQAEETAGEKDFKMDNSFAKYQPGGGK